MTTPSFADNIKNISNVLREEKSFQGLKPWQHDEILKLENLSTPTRKDELWKYLNLKELIQTPLENLNTNDTDYLSPEILSDIEELPVSEKIVFLNGKLSPELSSSLSGLKITKREDQTNPSPSQDAFDAANLITNDTTYLVEFSKNYQDNQPIGFIEINYGICDKNILISPRYEIKIHADTKVTLFQASLGYEKYTHLGQIHIDLDEHAYLKHYTYQKNTSSSFSLAKTFINQESNSHYIAWNLTLPGKIQRQYIESNLNGENSNVELKGLLLAHQKSQNALHTLVHHRVPHCDSKILIKGIIDDQAKGIFNGKVYVHPHAQKTNSEMTNKNLLLSNEAEIDPKPELEIYADDVKCSHGATVGQLDQNALFYLQSRGIPTQQARELLTHGFISDLLDQIIIDEIRHYLENEIFKTWDEKK